MFVEMSRLIHGARSFVLEYRPASAPVTHSMHNPYGMIRVVAEERSDFGKFQVRKLRVVHLRIRRRLSLNRIGVKQMRAAVHWL